jgi:hypothetical protein
MAGQPKIRKQVADLGAIGEDTLLDLVGDGMTVREIFRTFDVGRRAWYKWLDSEPGRREAFEEARERFAEQLDADSMEIADAVPVDKEHIAKAKLRIEARRHRAAMSDKKRRTKDTGGNTFNIGELHLSAVKEANDEAKALMPVEVVEGEDGTDD